MTENLMHTVMYRNLTIFLNNGNNVSAITLLIDYVSIQKKIFEFQEIRWLVLLQHMY
jgi:hypothetical protein